MDKVVNERTGETQPAAINVASSPVAVSIFISMVFKAAALFFPEYVPLGMEEKATQLILGSISLGADGFAFYKRYFSKVQPLKLRANPAAAVALLCFLPLAACNSTLAQREGSPTNAQIGAAVGTLATVAVGALPAETVETAKKYSRACGFIPKTETILRIGATLLGYDFGNAIELGSYIGQAICQAVRPTEAFASGAPPTVNGVPVEGRFAKRSKRQKR